MTGQPHADPTGIGENEAVIDVLTARREGVEQKLGALGDR